MTGTSGDVAAATTTAPATGPGPRGRAGTTRRPLPPLPHDRTHRTLVVPALDEVDAVPALVDLAATLDGVVDRVVVVDGGSTDGTVEAARAAGLEVLVAAERGPSGDVLGKGDSLWRVADLDTDVVVWRDADVRGVDAADVDALARAVEVEGIALAKGRFTRLQEVDGAPRPLPGRITAFVARPLLALLAPDLDHVTEPLSGQVAVRAAVLADLPVVTRYGVDVGLVLDVATRFGPAAVSTVEVGPLTHRSKDDASLVPMAHDVAATILARRRPLATDGPATSPDPDPDPDVAEHLPCAGPAGPLVVRPPRARWTAGGRARTP